METSLSVLVICMIISHQDYCNVLRARLLALSLLPFNLFPRLFQKDLCKMKSVPLLYLYDCCGSSLLHGKLNPFDSLHLQQSPLPHVSLFPSLHPMHVGPFGLFKVLCSIFLLPFIRSFNTPQSTSFSVLVSFTAFDQFLLRF